MNLTGPAGIDDQVVLPLESVTRGLVERKGPDSQVTDAPETTLPSADFSTTILLRNKTPEIRNEREASAAGRNESLPGWFALIVHVPVRRSATDDPETEQAADVAEVKLMGRPELDDTLGTSGVAVIGLPAISGKLIVCDPLGTADALTPAPTPPVVTATRRTV